MILSRTPYDKRRYTAETEAHYLRRGYVRMAQDLRGRYASAGAYQGGDHLSPQGLADAYDTVEWAALQPWSTGAIGMAGASYEGSTQWGAAIARPPHLKAIAPAVASSGRLFEQALFGGPPYYVFLLYWLLMMADDVADRLEAEGNDVTDFRRMLAEADARRRFEDLSDEIWRPDNLKHENYEEIVGWLPIATHPYFAFPGLNQLFKGALLGFNPDLRTQGLTPALGAEFPYRSDGPYDTIFWPYHEIDVAVLHIGGWYDFSNWAPFRNFNGMRTMAASPEARSQQHVLVGPWSHSKREPHGLTFDGSSFFDDTRQSQVFAFYDKYLKGDESHISPLRYFTTGENVWRTGERWPPDGASRTPFYLGPDRVLSLAPAANYTTLKYSYDPLDPTPTLGGRIMPLLRVSDCGPKPQNSNAQRQDVLAFETPPSNQTCLQRATHSSI